MEKHHGKREIEFDASSPGAFDSYGNKRFEDEKLPKLKDEEESLESKPESKYILVPMSEFEERFSIN